MAFLLTCACGRQHAVAARRPLYAVAVAVLLAAAVIGFQFFTWRSLASPPRWEYKVVMLNELGIRGTGDYSLDYSVLQEGLAEYGAEGWELAAVHHTGANQVHYAIPAGVKSPGSAFSGVAIFKRRVRE
jgi:hypothetical protein